MLTNQVKEEMLCLPHARPNSFTATECDFPLAAFPFSMEAATVSSVSNLC